MSSRTKCTKCGKIVDVMDIGAKAGYYDKDKNIVCFECFKENQDNIIF